MKLSSSIWRLRSRMTGEMGTGNMARQPRSIPKQRKNVRRAPMMSLSCMAPAIAAGTGGSPTRAGRGRPRKKSSLRSSQRSTGTPSVPPECRPPVARNAGRQVVAKSVHRAKPRTKSRTKSRASHKSHSHLQAPPGTILRTTLGGRGSEQSHLEQAPPGTSPGGRGKDQ